MKYLITQILALAWITQMIRPQTSIRINMTMTSLKRFMHTWMALILFFHPAELVVRTALVRTLISIIRRLGDRQYGKILAATTRFTCATLAMAKSFSHL